MVYRTKAMVGYLMNPLLPVKPNNIQMNPFFITLFQNVIRATAPTIESFKLAAQEQNEGFIYMIDQRDKNHPNTKTFDIVGAFELHSGKSTAEDYTPNPNYQIISDDGFFQLPEIFYTKILEAMWL